MYELTNQIQRGALKRRKLIQSISDGGEQKCCSTWQFEKTLSIKACKAIVVITQNEIMILKMSILCLF